MKTFKQFINEEASKVYSFEGSCFLKTLSDYVNGKGFKDDFMGVHGGDQFDFHITDIEISSGEDDTITKIKFDGWFQTSLRYSTDELNDLLTEYVGDVIESFTGKYPQMFEIVIK